MNNYDKFSEQGRLRFLTYEQEPMIKKFNLKADADKIYLPYLGKTLELIRFNGMVMCEGERCAMNTSMLVYDILTHSEGTPQLSGKWTSIAGLGGIIGAGHDQSLNENRETAFFAGKCNELAAACEKLGGVKQKAGDVSYIFPVFDFFPVWLQFWDAEEDEFPARLKFMWDENTLDFIFYETVWYLMGYLKERLRDLMTR